MAAAADPLMASLAAGLGMRWVGGAWERRLAGLCDGSIAAGWMCGLLFARLCEGGDLELHPVVAPVMTSHRYQNLPVYFADLVVRADAGFRSISDLTGTTLAYNETASLSGYQMLVDELGSLDGFAATVASGSHASSIHMVRTGDADVASIDSTLLDMLGVRAPAELAGLRVIGSLGPYPAPPVVATGDIVESVRARLLAVDEDAADRRLLAGWGIRRFAAVDTARYAELVSTTRSQPAGGPSRN